MKPLVSIIIPVYNAEKTIKKTINSIINQTYDNIEIIIVNDCSTDNSLKIITNFKNNFKNFKVISNSENKMALYNRIEGVRHSTGELITFIDADDWFVSNAIEVLVNNFIKTNADLVIGSWKLTFDRFGIFTIRHWNVYFQKPIEGYYNRKKIDEEFGLSYFGKIKLPVINWARLHKRKLFDEILKTKEFPKIIKSNDLYLNLLLFNNVNSISFIKDLTVMYRYGGGSQKASIDYLVDIYEVFILRKKLLENHPKKDEAQNYILSDIDYSYYFTFVNLYYLNKYSISKIKEIFDEVFRLESFQEMYKYYEKSTNCRIELYNFLKKNDLENAQKIIEKEINQSIIKRKIKLIISNILSSI